ncbi:Membrane protein [Pseudomonas syringae pv. actinidiae]|uniref:Membrane protein n=1 Tax=Pseudomonas syringae pv. actinidiae TaxID=103796 RepID=A0A3M4LC08_PSESF|nr:Membrane protein [Pseudomonas syringae pv. actinidiae]
MQSVLHATQLHFRHAAAGEHSTHAAHHFRHSALGGELLHHLLHLFVLLDQTPDILNLSARPLRDTALARAADQVRVAALGWRHRVDDGFHLLELLLGCALGIAHLRQVDAADAWQFVHETAEAAHVFHLLQLIAEVFEIEAFALLELFRQFVGFVFVEGLFGLFDQAEHVAHAEDSRSDTVRVKRLQRLALLAHADKLDRLAGDCTHRQCSTATSIAIDLGQDDTGQRQRIAECLGGVSRILAGHGIDHEQRFGWFGCSVQRLNLAHHLDIDVQTTGGIDDDHVDELQPGFLDGSQGDIHRLLADIGREERHADVVGQGFKLLDGGGTVHVDRHHHHGFLFALFKEARQLASGGGLARTLQTGHEDDRRRRDIEHQIFVGSAHQAFEFGLDDLHKRLARRQAARHLGADSTFLDAVDEVFDHRQGDVGFEQRHTHFAQGIFDVVLVQLGLASNVAQRLREAVGQIFKHARSFQALIEPRLVRPGPLCRKWRSASLRLEQVADYSEDSAARTPCRLLLWSFVICRLYAKLSVFSGPSIRIYVPFATQPASQPRRRSSLCRCDRLSRRASEPDRPARQTAAVPARRACSDCSRHRPLFPVDAFCRPWAGLLQFGQPDRRVGDCRDIDRHVAHSGGKPAGAALPARDDHRAARAVRAQRHGTADHGRARHPQPYSAVAAGLRHVHHRGVSSPVAAVAGLPAQAQTPFRADQELPAAANHGKPAVRLSVGRLDAALAVAAFRLAVRRKPVCPAPCAQNPAGVSGVGGVQRVVMGTQSPRMARAQGHSLDPGRLLPADARLFRQQAGTRIHSAHLTGSDHG